MTAGAKIIAITAHGDNRPTIHVRGCRLTKPLSSRRKNFQRLVERYPREQHPAIRLQLTETIWPLKPGVSWGKQLDERMHIVSCDGRSVEKYFILSNEVKEW